MIGPAGHIAQGVPQADPAVLLAGLLFDTSQRLNFPTLTKDCTGQTLCRWTQRSLFYCSWLMIILKRLVLHIFPVAFNPFDDAGQSLIDANLWFPAELRAGLGGVDNVSGILSKSFFSGASRFIEIFTHELGYSLDDVSHCVTVIVGRWR